MARSPLLLPRRGAGGHGMGTGLVALVIFAALAAGIASAAGLLRELPPFGAIHVGPWRSFPALGSPQVDPYGRAILTRGPHLPMALGEGLQFVAFSDGEGRGLRADCRYVVSGATLPSRGWTLAVADRDGRSLHGEGAVLTDGDIVAGEDGVVAITASRSPTGGNWLRLVTPGSFTLVLRFYDTPVSATASALDPGSLPAIHRTGCGG